MKDYKFLPSHEWFNPKDNTVGISDFAQSELGDIVFVELPEVGDTITQGQPFANIESVKAVSEVFSPVSGVVAEVNEALADNPELINQDAFNSWFIKVDAPEGADTLLDSQAYEASLA